MHNSSETSTSDSLRSTTIEYLPVDVEAKQLRTSFDPARLDPPTGTESSELRIAWYRQTPHDWFRVNYTDPNTDFHAGWHQDEYHPELGRAHVQYATTDDEDRWGATLEHATPSLLLWETVEALLKVALPYQFPPYRASRRTFECHAITPRYNNG